MGGKTAVGASLLIYWWCSDIVVSWSNLSWIDGEWLDGEICIWGASVGVGVGMNDDISGGIDVGASSLISIWDVCDLIVWVVKIGIADVDLIVVSCS